MQSWILKQIKFYINARVHRTQRNMFDCLGVNGRTNRNYDILTSD